jgi:hypothetical protein
MKQEYGQLDKIKLQAYKLKKKLQSSQKISVDIQSRFIAAGLLPAEAVATQILRFPLAKYLDLLAFETSQCKWEALKTKIKQQTAHIFDEETALYHPRQSDGALNIWCKDYAEAKAYLNEHSGLYLLHYKQSIFLARSNHIKELGLDPQDSDWIKIGYDWVKPNDAQAKQNLLEKLKKIDLSKNSN